MNTSKMNLSKYSKRELIGQCGWDFVEKLEAKIESYWPMGRDVAILKMGQEAVERVECESVDDDVIKELKRQETYNSVKSMDEKYMRKRYGLVYSRDVNLNELIRKRREYELLLFQRLEGLEKWDAAMAAERQGG